MRRLSLLLACAAIATAGGVLASAVLRPQTGPLALVAVFEVHLLALAVAGAALGIPGALGGGRARAWLRLALVGVLVLAVVRLGDEVWSLAPGDDASDGDGDVGAIELRVLTWNLELGSKAPADTVTGIAAVDADLVALQELTPEAAAAIEADPTLRARYPYRILDPGPGVDGMGLLARRPLVVGESTSHPLVLRAALLVDDWGRIDVLDVHPYPPGISTVARVAVGLDTRRRDGDLAAILGRVAALDDPAWAMVVGDLNAAPTEAGVTSVTAVLADAHAVAGSGPGFTWRPSSLGGLGLGLLRIDYVLSGPALVPVATETDCSLPGDHCRLIVTLRIPRPAP